MNLLFFASLSNLFRMFHAKVSSKTRSDGSVSLHTKAREGRGCCGSLSFFCLRQRKNSKLQTNEGKHVEDQTKGKRRGYSRGYEMRYKFIVAHESQPEGEAVVCLVSEVR